MLVVVLGFSFAFAQKTISTSNLLTASTSSSTTSGASANAFGRESLLRNTIAGSKASTKLRKFNSLGSG